MERDAGASGRHPTELGQEVEAVDTACEDGGRPSPQRGGSDECPHQFALAENVHTEEIDIYPSKRRPRER